MNFVNLVDVANFVKRTHKTFHADDVKYCLAILGSANQNRINNHKTTMQFVASMYIEESKDLLYTTIKLTKLNNGIWQYMEIVDDVVENYIPFF